MSKYLLPLVAALDMGSKIIPFPGVKFPIGANMAFRSEVFQRNGDFDVNLGRRGKQLEGGEEKDLFLRMKKHNEAIYYHPEVVVDHIIPQRRLEIDYIRKIAVGVGTSEVNRLAKKAFNEKAGRVVDELVKIGATFVLALYYGVTFQLPKSIMLVRFRFWVISGFLAAK